MRSPVCLSVRLRVSPPITFELIGRFLWNSVGRSYHWRWPRRLTFYSVPSTVPKWRTFKLPRWMQNLHQSTWDHQILYTDKSSKDEQPLIRPFLSKTKNTNMAAVWMLKFIVCFVETTHEPLHLDKWTLDKSSRTYLCFIWIIVLFDAVFKYDDGAKFRGYVGINAEPLCVEFCNFVQSYVFVNYLTFAVNELNIKT
jgi:hypothetical protein